MTIQYAIQYVLGSKVHAELLKCHKAMLTTLQTEAERELMRLYPCVLTDTTSTGQTTPPGTLQPGDKALWNKAVGFLTGSLYLASADGRQMFLLVKERIERPVTDGKDICEKTYKPVDVDALAKTARGDAFEAMAQIACVKDKGIVRGKTPSLLGLAGKRRGKSCDCC